MECRLARQRQGRTCLSRTGGNGRLAFLVANRRRQRPVRSRDGPLTGAQQFERTTRNQARFGRWNRPDARFQSRFHKKKKKLRRAAGPGLDLARQLMRRPRRLAGEARRDLIARRGCGGPGSALPYLARRDLAIATQAMARSRLGFSPRRPFRPPSPVLP
ncbi:hypothetical protein NL676_007138 [Syzygium grande]|nr:hypothetical protein NL676_007138 [Syzygium grande]